MASFLSEALKAQLMKVTGVTDPLEFEALLREHAPAVDIGKTRLTQTSPIDIQLVLYRESVENEGVQKYRELLDIKEKIQHVYSILSRDPGFQDVECLLPARKYQKNQVESLNARNLGNTEFQQKNYEAAIKSYGQSSLMATTNEEAALSIANRSVVFFRMKDYKACLEDCQAAKLLGYPSHLMYKLEERLGRVLIHIGKHGEGRHHLEQAIMSINASSLNEKKKIEIRDELEKFLLTVSESEDVPSVEEHHDIFKIIHSNAQFPCMSDAVAMKYEPQAGRHAVAKKTIQPGDILLVESPLVWTLSPGAFSALCYLCHKPVSSRHVQPYPGCDGGVVCSSDCLAEAQNKKICQKQELDYQRLAELFCVGKETGASAILALRCVRNQPLDYFVSHEQELFTERSPSYGIDPPKDWVMEGRDRLYKGLYNMVNHMDRLNYDTEIATIIKTVVLLRFLQLGDYFPTSSTSGSLTREELLIGRLLFQFQQGINFNQHGIYQISGKVEAGKNLPLSDIGTALYPTLIYLNHSCAPNTIRINHGPTTILVAKSRILAGEEVTDCYGIHHLSVEKAKRQATLQKSFHFSCLCKACEEDWPMLAGLESGLSNEQMGKLGTLLSKYQQQFRAGQLAEALVSSTNYLTRLADLRVALPHRNYEIAGLALASCLWAHFEA